MSRGSKSKGEPGRSSLLSQQENDKFEELLGRRCAVSFRAERGFGGTEICPASMCFISFALFAVKLKVPLKQDFLAASMRNIVAAVDPLLLLVLYWMDEWWRRAIWILYVTLTHRLHRNVLLCLIYSFEMLSQLLIFFVLIY